MNRGNDKIRGFTLVELATVIVVIGILVAISFIGFSHYQSDTRDARRVSSARAIIGGLEKFYDNNGEYPSCRAMTAAPETLSANTLVGIDLTTLITPQAPQGTTNSIKCTSDGTTLAPRGADFFEYQGDTSSACNSTGSCSKYTLKYKDESIDGIISINSQRGF